MSMGFSGQEYWSGLPYPIPNDLPNPGIEPKCLTSLALAAGFFTTSTAWEAFGFNYQIWVAQLKKVPEATDSYSKQSLCLTSDTFVSAGPWIILHSGGRSFLWGKMSPKRRQIRTTFRGGWIDLHLSLPVCWCLKFFWFEWNTFHPIIIAKSLHFHKLISDKVLMNMSSTPNIIHQWTKVSD